MLEELAGSRPRDSVSVSTAASLLDQRVSLVHIISPLSDGVPASVTLIRVGRSDSVDEWEKIPQVPIAHGMHSVQHLVVHFARQLARLFAESFLILAVRVLSRLNRSIGILPKFPVKVRDMVIGIGQDACWHVGWEIGLIPILPLVLRSKSLGLLATGVVTPKCKAIVRVRRDQTSACHFELRRRSRLISRYSRLVHYI